MTQSTAWASRTLAFVCMFLGTILAARGAHDSRLIVVQVAGFVVIGLALAAAALIQARTPANTAPGLGLTAALGIVCAAGGGISATHDGTLAVAMAAIAALIAGGDTKLGQALAVAGLGILGVLIGGVLSTATNAADAVGLIAIILTGLILGLHRRTYRVQAEQSAELLERAKQVQDLQRQTDVLDERARIAREIHDVLAHSLGGLGIQIQAARAVLTDHGDVDKALEVLATAQRLASDGLKETRHALHALRADMLSIDAELRNLTEEHGRLHHTKIAFDLEGTPRELPAAASVALLRVAQEAMINATKHAPRKPVEVRLEYTREQVRLTVDNPFSTPKSSKTSELETADTGYGLTGMRERLLLIGGTLHAGPQGETETWTVRAELPLPPTTTTED